MISMLLFAGMIGWIWKQRRYLFFLFFLLFYAWTHRMVNVAYIDVAGPVFAIELYRDIGGDSAAPWMLAAYGTAVLAVLIVFRPSRARHLARLQPPSGPRAEQRLRRMSAVAFWLFAAFVASLFLDMLANGVVPVLAGMERWTYTDLYGGPTHQVLMKYGHLVGFYFGLFYWNPSFYGRTPDNRFLYVLLATFLYLFLAGHRFSAFYSTTAFFVMPGAVTALRRGYGLIPRKVRSPVSRRLWTRFLQVGGAAAGASLIGVAMYRSLLFTRDMGVELAKFGLQQRLLVQQGELWTATYERVILRGVYDPLNAFDKLFVNPVALPGKNSTTPFLMELEIGAEAHRIIEEGVSYAGGYPEILFELLGPVLAFAGVFLMALVLAKLAYMLMAAIIEQRIVAIFLVMYVLWPFLLFHGSGMLNFLNNWKYLLKVSALLVWLLFERTRALAPRRVAVAPAT